MSATLARPSRYGVNNAASGAWATGGRSCRTLYVAFTSLFAVLAVFGLWGFLVYPHPANDFFAFNSFSRFIHQNPAPLIYDQDRLRQFQGLPQHKLFAFMYPPGMMLLLWPLAWLPYHVGYVAWVGVGLCAFVWVLGRHDLPTALMAVVAPSTLWTALCGQSSLLVAALLIGGLQLTGRRPLLAGVLLGLATYKPQLGILVPVALVAAGQWRVVGAATLTFLGVVLVSSAAFGSSVWTSWLQHLLSIVHVDTDHGKDWAQLLATVTSNMMMAGLSMRAAHLIQVAASVAAAFCIWRCCRHGLGDLQIAALAAATFLATPFAFTYDMPLMTGGVLLFANERRRSNGNFAFVEILVILAGLLLPLFVLSGWLQMCSSLVMVLLLAVALRRATQLRRNQVALSQGERHTVVTA